MNKIILFAFGFLSIYIASSGQAQNNKMLFIIDSIPLLNDPEDWNQILQEDIADYTVITHKDSLKLLGWEQMDGITYLFTKEYRNRPDSIKKIPGLKQMVMKNDAWHLNDSPYSGRYIDYYMNGRIQNEGTLLDGKLDGELRVYFKNGIKKSVTNYKDGIRNGLWLDYYKNGVLMQMNEFVKGKRNRTGETYFINGQVKQELRLKNDTRYDTSFIYYSTGKVKQMKITGTGEFHPDKKEANQNYHTTMFYEYLRTRNLKEANKHFYQIWMMDSTSTDTWFEEGLLLASEFRFDDAIAQFDKVLAIEPLMREALEQRGIARLKKYKIMHEKAFLKDRKDVTLSLEDIIPIPDDEQAKICNDLHKADEMDPGVYYGKKPVPESILTYCGKKIAH
ncbi:MAG TPA: hypothetical protein VK645_07010 [Chitinophagaceae bacterium]|nr:hypothetical protein [Chitinophagaceae bacterium]